MFINNPTASAESPYVWHSACEDMAESLDVMKFQNQKDLNESTPWKINMEPKNHPIEIEIF